MGEVMRLDKFLADCNLGTRKEVKDYIKRGQVTVNGVIVKDSGSHVKPGEDMVHCNNRAVLYEKYRYYMLNKPEGCVTANRDGLSRTVMDFLEGENTSDLFAVGRLDKDTEGLLLITNDGPLGHRLLSPKKHVDKTYWAVVSRALSTEEQKLFGEGVDIGDEKPTMPAEIRPLSGEQLRDRRQVALYEEVPEMDGLLPLYEVVLREGRFHQVKRMFEAFGSKVLYLKRVRMGPIELDETLEPGNFRRLTPEETEALIQQ